MRLPPNEAKIYYDWALALCNSDAVIHWSVNKYIGNVLKRCLEAIPAQDRMDLAETALYFPLPMERSAVNSSNNWPELIDEFNIRDTFKSRDNLKLAARIAELISIVYSDSFPDRDRAINRLHALYRADLLSDSEIGNLAKAVWGQTSADGWPATKELYPFIFLELPETESGRARELFYSVYIKSAAEGTIDAHSLNKINSGLRSSDAILEGARVHFGSIIHTCMNWKPTINVGGIVRYFEERENNEVGRAISDLLVLTLLPKVSVEDFSEDTRKAWDKHLADPNDRFMVATAFQYSRLFPERTDEMVHIVHKAVCSRNENRIVSGYHAVQQFIDGGGGVSPILISDVISTCESMREIGLAPALETATRLVKAGLLCDDDLECLAEGIELLWSEFSYDAEVIVDKRRIALTLVRSECSKLANALKQTDLESQAVEIVCREAARDPIPEVRYSV